MKIKINERLVGVDGTPLKGEKGQPITFKDIAVSSVLTPVQGDDERKKYEKYEIFRKLNNAKGDEVELKTEELNTLKIAIGKIQPPLIMGQCWDIIENK